MSSGYRGNPIVVDWTKTGALKRTTVDQSPVNVQLAPVMALAFEIASATLNCESRTRF